MAIAPEITLPIKTDPSQVIATIDVIVKHLTALRDELAAMSEPEPVVHASPPDGERRTPCCGENPFDLPRADQITMDRKRVTCQGGA